MNKCVVKKMFSLAVLSAVILFSNFSMAAPIKVANTEIDLVSEVISVNPGASFWLAIPIRHDKDWHTYWVNPGDSGLPITVDWVLPQGLSVGHTQWPYPEILDYGHLVSYGFKRDVAVLVEFKADRGLEPSQGVTIRANVKWLACKEICIPGRAALELRLPVATGVSLRDKRTSSLFRKARSEVPEALKDVSLKGYVTGQEYVVILPDDMVGKAEDVYFYAYEGLGVKYNDAQNLGCLTGQFSELVITKEENFEGIMDSLEGVLVFGPQRSRTAKEIVVALQPVTPAELALIRDQSKVSGEKGRLNVFLACLFAFMGGLILNLMPCVLPVLSIKIFGLIKHADDKEVAWKKGLIFGAGILVFFWLLAGALLVLKIGGENVGWGFQFQSPVFVAFIASLLFLIALNLFGVYEVGVSLTGIGSNAHRMKGYLGAFVSGGLTTIVATPCTAPFMGAALGFALTQSLWVAFLIFTCLGLGLAFPYILLTSFPQLLAFVPKPGRWMEYLKIFLGFILMVSVIWLLWVLGVQVGSLSVIEVLGGLWIISFGAWLYGRVLQDAKSKQKRVVVGVAAIFLVCYGFGFSIMRLQNKPVIESGSKLSAGRIGWQAYSQELVERLRGEGKAVFIDFTASWCLSCQVNDGLVFKNKRVIKKFQELNIVPIKADWTNRDPEITRALERFGKNSIPLYVIYGKNAKEPVLLPEIITPAIVLEALDLAI